MHAAIWPKQLSLSISRGLREQLVKDSLMHLSGFGTVSGEMSYEDEVSDQIHFERSVDHVSGKLLNPKHFELPAASLITLALVIGPYTLK